jgi:hypothetical protein
MYFFTTPPIKLKLGQQINGWESTNSKPPGPIITISQSEILSRSQIIFFITIFSQGVLCLFTRHCKLCKHVEPKTFVLRHTGMFSRFSMSFP